MTDYTWPDDLAPVVQAYWLQPHVGRSQSPFTRQTKTYGLSAPLWVTTMSFRGGYDNAGGLRDVGGRIDATLAKLAGGANRALVYDFRRPTRTGAGVTMQSLDGAVMAFDGGETFDEGETFFIDWNGGPPGNEAVSAGASAITWTGFQSSKTIFKAGDYVGGDGRAHLVLDDAIAGADFKVTLNVSPPFKADVPAGAGIFEKVTTPFRLTEDGAGSNATEVGQAVAYDLSMIEDL